MRPSLKFGLIGGVIFAIILVVSNYFLELTAANYTASVYLKELVLIVSVIAAVKGVRDLDRGVALELRTGLRAGLTTTILIGVFIFVFNLVYPFTITETEFTAANEVGYMEYLKRVPITDTSAIAFNKKIASFDSAMKVNNIFSAYFNLRRAKAIHPDDTDLNLKLKDLDHQLFTKSQEMGFLMKNVFMSYVFPQLVMGFLVSFVSSMLFRYKQQQEL